MPGQYVEANGSAIWPLLLSVQVMVELSVQFVSVEVSRQQ